MTIQSVPVPPLNDLSRPQQVQRLLNYLRDEQTVTMRLSDNIDTPTAPSAIAVRQGAGKVVEVSVTFSEPSDWGSTELWRNTSDDVTTAAQIDSQKSHTFHDVNVSYGSTYYYFARVVGMSGTSTNTSGWSPSSGHSITVSQVVNADLGTGSVQTGTVAPNAVSASGVFTDDSNPAIGSSEGEIGTLTVSAESNTAVVVIGVAEVTKTANAGSVTLKIRKGSAGGSVLGQGAVNLGIGESATVTLIGYDSSPAASQTYKLTGFYTGAAGGNANLIRLVPFNLKR